VIREPVDEIKFGRTTQFFREAALHCLMQFFAFAGVTTARIGPVFRPEKLGFASFLKQNFVVIVKKKDRKCAMQRSRAHMCLNFTWIAADVIFGIDSD
jgi:hypothetical protein